MKSLGFEKLFSIFEDLLKRGFAPSLVFFTLAGFANMVVTFVSLGALRYWLEYWSGWITQVSKATGSGVILLSLLLLVLIGWSYVLMTLNQIMFDDRLRRSFSSQMSRLFDRFRERGRNQGGALGPNQGRRSESHEFEELRQTVVRRIAREKELFGDFHQPEVFSDYTLYEIIGGIDPTDTRKFVDWAKLVGITFVSVILVTTGTSAYLAWRFQTWRWLTLALAVIPIWFLGLETVRTFYRSRNTRLYVNFLMMPRERLVKILDSGASLPSPESTEIE